VSSKSVVKGAGAEPLRGADPLAAGLPVS
jgi:hypothetical protein